MTPGIARLLTSSADHHGAAGFEWRVDVSHDFVVLLVAAAAATWYLRAGRAVTVHVPGQPWPVRYTWFFLTGLVMTVLVTTGPVAHAAMSRFSFHMVQHIVLMMLATPLLVMGAPVLLLLRSSTPAWRRSRVVPVLHSRAFSVATNPVVSWLAFAAVLVGIHFTPAMSALMGFGPLGRYAEYALYIGVAACFYYTLLPGNPARNRPDPALGVVSLFLIMIPETMTGFFIYSAGFALFPYFADATDVSAQSALADQQLGGALMWSTAMIIDVAWIAVAVHHWFGAEIVKTTRLDARYRREGVMGGTS